LVGFPAVPKSALRRPDITAFGPNRSAALLGSTFPKAAMNASSSLAACAALLPIPEMNRLFAEGIDASDATSGVERRHLLPTSKIAHRTIALPFDASGILRVQHDAFRLVEPACLVRLPLSEFRVGDNIEFVCFSAPGRGTTTSTFTALLISNHVIFIASSYVARASSDNIGQIKDFSQSAGGIIFIQVQLYLNHSETDCPCGFSTHSEKEVFLSRQTLLIPATHLRRHIAVLSLQQFCSAYIHQLPSVSSEPEHEAPHEPIAKPSLPEAATKILRDSEFLCRFHVDSHSILLPCCNSSGFGKRECIQLGTFS
jgi:hypothetical protein